NHFKPYNDIYGYEQGDQIIKWLAQILQKQLFRHGHFIGHIGGDDFVAIFKDTNKEQTEQQCNKIIREARFLMLFLTGLTTIAVITLWLTDTYDDIVGLRHALFEVVSVATTAGFAVADFSGWPGALPFLLFV
ncbi:diguanylate cyclase, partial [Burkholderia sp. SIMBA_057]